MLLMQFGRTNTFTDLNLFPLTFTVFYRIAGIPVYDATDAGTSALGNSFFRLKLNGFWVTTSNNALNADYIAIGY